MPTFWGQPPAVASRISGTTDPTAAPLQATATGGAGPDMPARCAYAYAGHWTVAETIHYTSTAHDTCDMLLLLAAVAAVVSGPTTATAAATAARFDIGRSGYHHKSSVPLGVGPDSLMQRSSRNAHKTRSPAMHPTSKKLTRSCIVIRQHLYAGLDSQALSQCCCTVPHY